MEHFMPEAGFRWNEEIKAWQVIIPSNKRVAFCGICGEPVPHAYLDGMGQIHAEEGFAICSDDNIAYHYEPSKDCWGKKTGYPNFQNEKGEKRVVREEIKDDVGIIYFSDNNEFHYKLSNIMSPFYRNKYLLAFGLCPTDFAQMKKKGLFHKHWHCPNCSRDWKMAWEYLL